jgi:hypothetical protein
MLHQRNYFQDFQTCTEQNKLYKNALWEGYVYLKSTIMYAICEQVLVNFHIENFN